MAMKKLIALGAGLCMAAGFLAPLYAADDVSVTGNLVDTYCYTTMGAHGPSHAKCAAACARKGIPVGLVQTGTNKMFVLLPPKNGESLPGSVISNMEKQVTVTGQEIHNGDATFLTVKSLK